MVYDNPPYLALFGPSSSAVQHKPIAPPPWPWHSSVMWNDEDQPKNAPQPLRNLDPLSVAELEAYIADLKAEITRAEAEINKKGSAKSAAEAFFRK